MCQSSFDMNCRFKPVTTIRSRNTWRTAKRVSINSPVFCENPISFYFTKKKKKLKRERMQLSLSTSSMSIPFFDLQVVLHVCIWEPITLFRYTGTTQLYGNPILYTHSNLFPQSLRKTLRSRLYTDIMALYIIPSLYHFDICCENNYVI